MDDICHQHYMSSVKLPTEVQDIVIDHLHDDRKILKQCSLVCRGWVFSSSFHLFRWFLWPPCQLRCGESGCPFGGFDAENYFAHSCLSWSHHLAYVLLFTVSSCASMHTHTKRSHHFWRWTRCKRCAASSLSFAVSPSATSTSLPAQLLSAIHKPECSTVFVYATGTPKPSSIYSCPSAMSRSSLLTGYCLRIV
jgi:hypothetical protein